MEKIKCCPFCGSKKVDVARTNEQACWVECAKCGAQTDSAPTRRKAISNWNKRTKSVSHAKVVWDMDKIWTI